MKKVVFYSVLLLIGLVSSQLFPQLLPEIYQQTSLPIRLLTMFCLSFIMIHVGLEFDIDKNNVKEYALDYGIAATAAGLPWIFCALYFIFVMSPGFWGDSDIWKQSFLLGRFSAPTSAGILFSMLAAAGLSATWVFKKARILAIFDDLDTVLLLIPLKMMMIGLQWQFGIILLLMGVQLYLAWKYLHKINWPLSWRWIFLYSAIIVGVCEMIYIASKWVDKSVPLHLEVLLPAFVLGCMLAHSKDKNHQQNLQEEKVSSVVSGAFMLLVGLSMPAIFGAATTVSGKLLGGSWPGWGTIALHVLAITVISNIGKMFALFCYKKEATFKERLALCIGMFPRGEVGAGVMVLSLSYGISGAAVTVAMLSLALNLLLTGFFIMIVKKLLNTEPVKI